MSLSSKIATAKAQYFSYWTDEMLSNSIVEIIGEIKANKYSSAEKLTLWWTVGDLVECDGWYADSRVIGEMVEALQGRALRGVCVFNGIDLTSPSNKVAEFILSTNAQTERASIIALSKSIKKFGQSQGLKQSDVDKLEMKMQLGIQQMMTRGFA